MTKDLRIISIPLRAVDVNEKFTVTIRVAKELRVEYVKFLYCQKDNWFDKREKIPKDRIRQEVLSIMGKLFQISKNFLISYDENMEADKKEMIQDALYEERMYFEIEGIVVKEK